eukprot:RCo024772
MLSTQAVGAFGYIDMHEKAQIPRGHTGTWGGGQCLQTLVKCCPPLPSLGASERRRCVGANECRRTQTLQQQEARRKRKNDLSVLERERKRRHIFGRTVEVKKTGKECKESAPDPFKTNKQEDGGRKAGDDRQQEVDEARRRARSRVGPAVNPRKLGLILVCPLAHAQQFRSHSVVRGFLYILLQASVALLEAAVEQVQHRLVIRRKGVPRLLQNIHPFAVLVSLDGSEQLQGEHAADLHHRGGELLLQGAEGHGAANGAPSREVRADRFKLLAALLHSAGTFRGSTAGQVHLGNYLCYKLALHVPPRVRADQNVRAQKAVQLAQRASHKHHRTNDAEAQVGLAADISDLSRARAHGDLHPPRGKLAFLGEDISEHECRPTSLSCMGRHRRRRVPAQNHTVPHKALHRAFRG